MKHLAVTLLFIFGWFVVPASARADGPSSSQAVAEETSLFWARAGIGAGLNIVTEKTTYASEDPTQTVTDERDRDVGVDVDLTLGAFVGPYLAAGGTFRLLLGLGLNEGAGPEAGSFILGPDLTVFPFGDHLGPTLRMTPGALHANDSVGWALSGSLGYTFKFGRQSATGVGLQWTSAFLTDREYGDQGVYRSTLALHQLALVATIQRR